ncbi:MAG: UvrD-helicase domain-containing protein [Prevotellaceae bacterium]|nr:UvrD-helicase domain-containing protein [Prevotellaceae bacterium]
MEDLRNRLNERQYRAATEINGASLIIAGAGSGKTRTLTYRIAYMISQGIAPQNILALTFTNKAANEMRERIKSIAGRQNSYNLWMGTFHSIFARILRSEPDATGFSENFTIYDTADSKSLIKSIINELGYDETKYKPNEVLSRISKAKNALVTPDYYASNVKIIGEDQKQGKPYILNIYAAYVQKCRLANAMDFDDLLLKTNILFRDHIDVLKKYQDKFKYILIDEYQDTNYSQYMIIKKLAEPHGNVCVVGDDAQSIYAFRGARIENILNFRNDYPNYREFKLEENYRSTQTIVNAANSVIKNNSNQLKKTCFSKGETGEKIGVIKSYTDQEEGFLIVNSISEVFRKKRISYGNFAILYRTNAQSRVFEDALRRKNIPYKIYGGLSFYQRAEIKDFIAYLRLCVNHSDDEAFKRIINYPTRGIGNTTMERLQIFASSEQKSLFDAVKSKNIASSDIKPHTYKKLRDFVDFIENFTTKAFITDAFEFARDLIAESGILADLKQDISTEGKSRYENIESLINGIKEFCDNKKTGNENDESDLVVTINEYLENIALITDADNEKTEDADKISLMTVHQAKGLEYDYVYITGMEENIFPGMGSSIDENELEEERRLFYVAVTRAKVKVNISFSQLRYRWGKNEYNKISRFVHEIDEEFLETKLYDEPETNKSNSSNYTNGFVPKTSQSAHNTVTTFIKRPQIQKHNISENFVASDNKDIRIGMRIEHNRFGYGKVIDIDKCELDGRITVMFDDNTKKTLLLKYAKIRIVK